MEPGASSVLARSEGSPVARAVLRQGSRAWQTLKEEGGKSCHRAPGRRRVRWPVGSDQGTPRTAQDLWLFILPNFIPPPPPQMLTGGSSGGKAEIVPEAGLFPFRAGPAGTV